MSESEPQAEDLDLKQVETYAKANVNNLPPQYNGDPEKFIKSWKDMRAEITRLQQNAKAPVAGEEQEAPRQDATPPEKLVIPDKPVPTPQATEDEWNKWGGEIATNGALNDETREAIKKRYGIPDAILNSYVDGVRLKQKEVAASAAETVGGAQSLNDILAWSTENLTDEERGSVNESLKRPGWQNVLLGLKSRMDSSAHKEPKSRVSTTTGVPYGVKPFANQKELVAAMRDPKYKYDPEYQAAVAARVRITGHTKND